MSRRRNINAGPSGRSLRSLLAVLAVPLGDLGGFFEQRLLWPAADLARAAGEALRWPFERLAWLAEERLVWPLQERLVGRGPSAQAVGAGALATLAVGAVALGAVALSGGDGADGVEVASPVASATATPASQPRAEAPRKPALEGVAPSFGVTTSGGDGGAPGGVAAARGETSEPASGSPDAEVAGGATSSSAKPVPAGPAAMKAARRFAEAFVFYEIGERPGRARTVFEETATPRLAAALAERPPRQPASAEVPKARVLNLVPGPRSGRTYTVSASLLRVGVTSELRLKMKKQAGTWVVTDVRG